MKEKYITEMKLAIDTCKGNTCYLDKEIAEMKENGEKIFNEIFALDGTTYHLEEYKKDVEIKIEKYVFGHNDFKVYFYDDFMVSQSLKEIFLELKQKDKEKGIEAKLGKVGGNGYGTAFVLGYDLK